MCIILTLCFSIGYLSRQCILSTFTTLFMTSIWVFNTCKLKIQHNIYKYHVTTIENNIVWLFFINIPVIVLMYKDIDAKRVIVHVVHDEVFCHFFFSPPKRPWLYSFITHSFLTHLFFFYHILFKYSIFTAFSLFYISPNMQTLISI